MICFAFEITPSYVPNSIIANRMGLFNSAFSGHFSFIKFRIYSSLKHSSYIPPIEPYGLREVCKYKGIPPP